MEIPLVVALWENASFSGHRRLVVENTRSLADQAFNDVVSSVGVHPGPDYAAWKAAHGGREPTACLFENLNFSGEMLILTAGEYPNLHRLASFGDCVSSIGFNMPRRTPATIAPIPIVAEIYADANFTGRRAVIVENVPAVGSYLGAEFNDVVTSVRVKRGPGYEAGRKAYLYRDVNYLGGFIELDPGDYPNIGTSHGFNDVVSSIKVR